MEGALWPVGAPAPAAALPAPVPGIFGAPPSARVGAVAPPGEHGGDFAIYERSKLQKLSNQRAADVAAADAFLSGVAVWFNGYLEPPVGELEALLVAHGGRREHYFSRTGVTHVIAMNLPDGKVRDELKLQKGPMAVVRPRWLVDSVAARRRLPIDGYLLAELQSSHGADLRALGFGAAGGRGGNRGRGDGVGGDGDGRGSAARQPPLPPQPLLSAGAGPTAASAPAAFIASYFANSRLHHIGSARSAAVALVASVNNARHAAAGAGAGLDGSTVLWAPAAIAAAAAAHAAAEAAMEVAAAAAGNAEGAVGAGRDGDAPAGHGAARRGAAPLWGEEAAAAAAARGRDGDGRRGAVPPAVGADIAGDAGGQGRGGLPSDLDVDDDDDGNDDDDGRHGGRSGGSDSEGEGGDIMDGDGDDDRSDSDGGGGRSAHAAARSRHRRRRRAGGAVAGVDTTLVPRGVPGAPRVIVHADMDCFFVSVALLRRPDLVGRPCAVAHGTPGGGGSGSARVAAAAAVGDGVDARRMASAATSASASASAVAARPRPSATAAASHSANTYHHAAGGATMGSEVSSANYAARACGVHAGMGMAEARARCPDLTVLPYDFAAIAAATAAAYRCFLAVTPLVEATSCDEAYLDITALAAQLPGGDATPVVAALRRAVAAATGGCTLSAGVGTNKLLARLATARAKPDGLVVAPSPHEPAALAAFLGPTPVGELPGVGSAAEAALEAHGVSTVAHAAAVPRADLRAWLGAAKGDDVASFARGRDDRPVVVRRPQRSVGVDVNYGIRLRTHGEAAAFAVALGAELARRLAECGREATVVAGGAGGVVRTSPVRAGAPAGAQLLRAHDEHGGGALRGGGGGGGGGEAGAAQPPPPPPAAAAAPTAAAPAPTDAGAALDPLAAAIGAHAAALISVSPPEAASASASASASVPPVRTRRLVLRLLLRRPDAGPAFKFQGHGVVDGVTRSERFAVPTADARALSAAAVRMLDAALADASAVAADLRGFALLADDLVHPALVEAEAAMGGGGGIRAFMTAAAPAAASAAGVIAAASGRAAAPARAHGGGAGGGGGGIADGDDDTVIAVSDGDGDGSAVGVGVDGDVGPAAAVGAAAPVAAGARVDGGGGADSVTRSVDGGGAAAGAAVGGVIDVCGDTDDDAADDSDYAGGDREAMRLSAGRRGGAGGGVAGGPASISFASAFDRLAAPVATASASAASVGAAAAGGAASTRVTDDDAAAAAGIDAAWLSALPPALRAEALAAARRSVVEARAAANGLAWGTAAAAAGASAASRKRSRASAPLLRVADDARDGAALRGGVARASAAAAAAGPAPGAAGGLSSASRDSWSRDGSATSGGAARAGSAAGGAAVRRTEARQPQQQTLVGFVVQPQSAAVAASTTRSRGRQPPQPETAAVPVAARAAPRSGDGDGGDGGGDCGKEVGSVGVHASHAVAADGAAAAAVAADAPPPAAKRPRATARLADALTAADDADAAVVVVDSGAEVAAVVNDAHVTSAPASFASLAQQLRAWIRQVGPHPAPVDARSLVRLAEALFFARCDGFGGGGGGPEDVVALLRCLRRYCAAMHVERERAESAAGSDSSDADANAVLAAWAAPGACGGGLATWDDAADAVEAAVQAASRARFGVPLDLE